MRNDFPLLDRFDGKASRIRLLEFREEDFREMAPTSIAFQPSDFQ